MRRADLSSGRGRPSWDWGTLVSSFTFAAAAAASIATPAIAAATKVAASRL